MPSRAISQAPTPMLAAPNSSVSSIGSVGSRTLISFE
jgi:hypothetical protein